MKPKLDQRFFVGMMETKGETCVAVANSPQVYNCCVRVGVKRTGVRYDRHVLQLPTPVKFTTVVHVWGLNTGVRYDTCVAVANPPPPQVHSCCVRVGVKRTGV